MKVLVIENSLDDLLNVKISVNGGQSYTDYSVSSLKNGGLTLDCNPSDLKVICDTNILNYIKVFADGEKLNTGSGGDFLGAYSKHIARGYCFWVCSSKDIAVASWTENEQDYDITVVNPHCIAVSGSINVEKFNITFTDGQTVELDTITDVSY